MDRVHVPRRLLRVGGQRGGKEEPDVPALLMLNEFPGLEVVPREASRGEALRLEVEELPDLLRVSEGQSDLLDVHHQRGPGPLLHHRVLPLQVLALLDPLPHVLGVARRAEGELHALFVADPAGFLPAGQGVVVLPAGPPDVLDVAVDQVPVRRLLPRLAGVDVTNPDRLPDDPAPSDSPEFLASFFSVFLSCPAPESLASFFLMGTDL